MKYDLILSCGIGKCASGFLSYFMFLNSKISVWNGPGMGELYQHVAGKSGLPLSDFYHVWKDDYHEPTHNDNWVGHKDFATYHKNRIKTRAGNDVFFIKHNMGERHYPTYKNHFDCNILAVYCGREIVDHYRSFRQAYSDMTAEGFLYRIRGTLAQMKVIVEAGLPVVYLNTPDNSVPTVKKEFGVLMSKIGMSFSKEQTSFLKRRRKLGAGGHSLELSDKKLLTELRKVKDFEQLRKGYDTLRAG